MPRKSKRSLLNSQKPPLLFLEPPLDGARHQNLPQVRGALNPKSFVDDRRLNTTARFTSWVSPQFGESQLNAHSSRQGRRKKCTSTTSIPDRSFPLSRKVSVCQFPSLTFEKGPRRRATASTRFEVLRDHSAKPKIAVNSALTPVEPCTPETSRVFTPPDVNTPELQQEGNSCPSTPFLRLLFPISHPLTPSDTKTTDILVADTPERDYGVRVTRRKKRSMTIPLKDRGHLS
ncbi:RAD9, HUS1, RAD1-interacting nuclear orphan protein 1 [Aplochiton taeniatus]